MGNKPATAAVASRYSRGGKSAGNETETRLHIIVISFCMTHRD